MSPIELDRGSTLKLEHAAGASVLLVMGQAWFCARDGNERLRMGEVRAVGAVGATLIHALEHASLRLEAGNGCRIEVRRRGEVAALPPLHDDERIDLADDSAVAGWARVLCCTPRELRNAVRAAGPGVGDVTRHLFAALLRRRFKSKGA